MYAIIRSGAKQYRVKAGDVIHVELLAQDVAPGTAVEFREVLFLGQPGEGGQFKIGAPLVEGCVVKAECLGEVKGPKIESVKYKRRKNCYRKFGHRQKYSQVKITDIVG